MARKSARKFRVLVSGFKDPWQTATGPEATVDITEEYDGGDDGPNLFEGRRTYSDITVERQYDDHRDAPQAVRLLNRVGRDTRTLTFYPLDDDGVPIRAGKMTVVGRLKGVKTPDVDKNSSAAGKFRLTFHIKSVS